MGVILAVVFLVPWVVGVGACYGFLARLAKNVGFISKYARVDQKRMEAELAAARAEITRLGGAAVES